MSTSTDLAAVTPEDMIVDIRTRGAVGAHERDCVHAMISAVLIHHRQVTDDARIRVTGPACAGGPVLMQVNVRVCGAPARVQVAGPNFAAAVAVVAARLHRQIQRLSGARQPGPQPGPQLWPWPDPERRPLGVPGAARISRRKRVRLHVAAACQAAAHLNAMDYDAFLFTDAETGEDAIVYRSGPAGLALARQRTMRPPSLPGPLPLTVNPRKTPVLTAAQAAAQLADGWLPFLFYTDAADRRGHLLYRRYDGELGLVLPSAPDPAHRTGRPLPMMPPNVAR